jgi:chromosome segregation ATPase
MIVKEMEAMQTELAGIKAEMVKVMAGSDEIKAQLQGALEAKASLEKAIADGKVEAEKQSGEMKAELEKVNAENVELKQSVEAMKAQMALVPVVQSEGRAPIAEGGEAAPVVDWAAKLNALSGAELVKCYRDNKAEIDAFKKRQK